MRTPPPAPLLQMPSSSSTHAVDVDVDVDVSIWHAVAGLAVNVPPVNSYVYYFPQGHLEQWSPYAAVPNFNFNLTPPIACQVISVRYLTDRTSDRVMARIHLQPLSQLGPPLSRDGNGDEDEDEEDDGDIVSFVKVLSQSDETSLLSVPRVCADMILPKKLNFEAHPPEQNLELKDTRGNSWKFRHIYRGKPLRHILTSGWCKFVDTKSLVAGDSVVFMKKKSTNELFIGIRPAQQVRGDGSEAVAAVESAVKGMAFEVAYYPKVDVPDFVVMAEKVEKAIEMAWGEGMRVRMAMESGESWRKTWTHGVVTAISASTSLWRILQVSWEPPDDEDKVNPWQVEVEPLISLIDNVLPSPKRFKGGDDGGGKGGHDGSGAGNSGEEWWV